MIEIFLTIGFFLLISHLTIDKYLRDNSIFIKLIGYIMPLIIVTNLLLMVYNIIAMKYLFVGVPLTIQFTYLKVINWITKRRKKHETISYGSNHIGY